MDGVLATLAYFGVERRKGVYAMLMTAKCGSDVLILFALLLRTQQCQLFIVLILQQVRRVEHALKSRCTKLPFAHAPDTVVAFKRRRAASPAGHPL